MTPALRVLAAGLHTTVQDFGRPGYQHAGVPVSGALDPVALALANRLVGNTDGAAGLEIAFQGPTLVVEADAVRVAVAGTAARIEILGDEARAIPAFRTARLARGTRFRVAALSGSATAMLAVEGGFALPAVLGSLSTYVRGGLGGLCGRALREGDALPLTLAAPEAREERHATRAALPAPGTVRVLPGPQADHFGDDAHALFLASAYRVARASDRMGMRLDGPALAHALSPDIVSDGIAPGAVQVPGSGQPIVLLADRQTTGGYPKIAVVISADLPGLGRLAPGASIRFERVTPEAAANARRAARAAFDAMARSIAPVGARAPDEADLLTQNLVSGVIDAEGW